MPGVKTHGSRVKMRGKRLRIIYSIKYKGNIIKLRNDGAVLIGPARNKLKEHTFYRNPLNRKPWIPLDRATFVETIEKAIDSGEFGNINEDAR